MSGYILIWSEADRRANEILRQAAQKVRYKYAWHKLRHARFHIIETHTQRISEEEYRGQYYVSNGEAC